MLARRSVFDRVGLLDESLWFSDAAEWFLRAAERGTIVELLPDVLVYHRLHGRNLTLRRPRDSADEFLDLVKARLDRGRRER